MNRKSFLAMVNAGMEFISGLLVILFVTRFYGSNETGKWFLFTAIVSMIGMMRDALIQSALIRDTAQITQRHHSILKTNLMVVLIVEGIIAVGSYTAYACIDFSWRHWILLIPACSTINAIYRWQVFYLRGQAAVSTIAWGNSVQLVALITGLVVVYFFQLSMEAFVWVSVLSQLATTIYCSQRISYLKIFKSNLDYEHWRAVQKFGFFAMGRESLSALSSRVGLFITETYLTLTQASILGISQRFSQMALLPNNAFQSLLLPQLVISAREKNLVLLRSQVYRGLSQLLMITVPITLVGIFFVPFILRYLLPTEYSGAWVYISIYTLIGTIITPFGSAFGSIVTALEKPHLAFRLVGINSILNCSLTFLLIHHWGIIGAPISMLIVEIVGWFIVYRILKQQAGVNLYSILSYMAKIVQEKYAQITYSLGSICSEVILKFKL